MFRLMIVAVASLTFATAAQPKPDCEDPATAFDDWFAEMYEDFLADNDSIQMRDVGWAELFDDFSDYAVDFVDECAQPEDDLAYVGEFRSPEDSFFKYDVVPSLAPLDINLDGVDDWLLRLDLRRSGLGNSRGFVRVLYWDDDAWLTTEIWNPERLELSGAVPESQPGQVYVHEQADSQGRSYMGVFFNFGAYVGGLSVLRWDEWQPEEVLFFEQACVFASWERGSDGGLYIPHSTSIPWEGCTFPNPDPEAGIPIPDAHMPDSAD